MEYRQRSDGRIEWRWITSGGHYPGFDGVWRILTEAEIRDHLRTGGPAARWLKSLDAV